VRLNLRGLRVRTFAYAYANKVIAESFGTIKRVMIAPSTFGTRTTTRLQMVIEHRYIDVGQATAFLLEDVAEVSGSANVAHGGPTAVSV
jgi:hypothetical protein